MNKRVQESIAMMMIGDGVLALTRPQEHCGLWLRGPATWQRMAQWFVEHPEVTRMIGVAEAVAGLWWSFQLQPAVAELPAAKSPASS